MAEHSGETTDAYFPAMHFALKNVFVKTPDSQQWVSDKILQCELVLYLGI